MSVAAPARLASSFVPNTVFLTRSRDSLQGTSSAFPSSPSHAPRASSHPSCHRSRASAGVRCALPPASHGLASPFGSLFRRVSVVRQGGAALIGLLLGQSAGAGLQASDSGVRGRGDNATVRGMKGWTPWGEGGEREVWWGGGEWCDCFCASAHCLGDNDT